MKFNQSKVKRIDIKAPKHKGSIVISVADNGIGIDEKYMDQIFTIFKKLHDQEKFSGSGIGLALCKKIVERMGGKIWVESELYKGTTFFMEFPDRLIHDEI